MSTLVADRTTPPGTPLRTVPAAALSLLALNDDERAAVLDAAVVLGNAVEVDVRHLENAVPGVGRRAWGYWGATRALWADLVRGLPVSGVEVHSPLVRAKQGRKGPEADLRCEFEALELVAGCVPVLDLLDPEPDFKALGRLGSLLRDDASSSLELEVAGAIWPAVLGGAARPGELHRRVSAHANHAAWRDRRLRRLTRLEITAVELWPDPSSF